MSIVIVITGRTSFRLSFREILIGLLKRGLAQGAAVRSRSEARGGGGGAEGARTPLHPTRLPFPLPPALIIRYNGHHRRRAARISGKVITLNLNGGLRDTVRTVRLSFVNVTLGKQVAQAGIIVIRVEALGSVQAVIGYKTSVRRLVIVVGGAGALRAIQQAGRDAIPGAPQVPTDSRGPVVDGVRQGGMVAG